MKFLFSACVFSSLATTAVGREGWVFGTRDGVTLPKAISDHTATLSSDGMVYIAGGCDGENGNEWDPAFGDNGMFLCGSISDSLYSFDPVDGVFAELTKLPRARYRHSAAIVDNKLWIMGGRTLYDNLIAEIDIYDIANDEWSVAKYDLAAKYVVSDHTSFAHDGKVYIAGGYDQDYTVASSTVVALGESDGMLTYTEAPSLDVGRGDIHSAVSEDGKSVYIAGGFNPDVGFWCTPLNSVERLDFGSSKWVTLPNLITERAEVVLVDVSNNLYALGGEQPLNVEACLAQDYIDPGELTMATDFVEFLDEPDDDDDETKWVELLQYPEDMFRFAAVGVKDQGLIYAFGGQKAFDPECGCQDGSNSVFIFGEKENVEAVGTVLFESSGSTMLSLFPAFFVGALSFAYTYL